MHLKRWITGLSALPVLIYLVYQGGVLFNLLVSVGCLICLWEYVRIVITADGKKHATLIVGWGFVIGLVIIWAAYFAGPGIVMVVIALNLLGSAFFSLWHFRADSAVTDLVRKQIQGIVYIPLLLSFLVLIRNSPQGMIWIFYLLGIIFAGDICALYVGTMLGRHKLRPAVSPGKTVEGSLGGITANLVVGVIGKYYFLPQPSWGLIVLFVIAVGVAGQIGDLFESELKRVSSMKDSGGLLPGHGGFLDRIDALLFAAPVAYFFIMYIF